MKTWKNSAQSISMSHVLHSYGRKPSGQQWKPSHHEYAPCLLSKKHGGNSLLIIFFAFLYSSYEIVQHFFRPWAMDRFFFVVLPELNFSIKPSIVILQPSINFPLLSDSIFISCAAWWVDLCSLEDVRLTVLMSACNASAMLLKFPNIIFHAYPLNSS